MKAMIFAAGLGTRLKPITDSLPKALLPLGGKTLLQWQIEKLRSAGIRDIVINVHHFADQIIDYIDGNRAFGCNIRISDEREQLLETGGGLWKAKDLLCSGEDEPVLVCNVDILSNIDIASMAQAYSSDLDALLVVSDRQTQRYLLFDEAMRLHGWTNIATQELRPASVADALGTLRRLAFSGMQILSPRIFEAMGKFAADKGARFSLIDVYIALCQSRPIYGFVPTDYKMMDVGKIDQLQEAEAFAQALFNL
ncbi:MAG: nucleotidyltransferase family protein [Paludibacteraceae bacterium]